MQVYGIDLSKEKFDVSFIDAKGEEKNLKDEKRSSLNIKVFIFCQKRSHSVR